MKGQFHLIRGEARVEIRRGVFDVIGQRLEAGGAITVPRGKAIILMEMATDCLFEVTGLAGAETTRLEQSPYPPEWELLIATIKENHCKRIIVLGEMDTGKTFLCTYLANRMMGEGFKVGVIDCDLGQSDIGPPGCLGLSLTDKPFIFMADAPVSGLHFVGTHSPEGHLTSMLVGLHQLIGRANRESDTIFIDTCGWTLGDGARLLKGAKFAVLEPDLVVLLQRNRELEHLVASFPAVPVFRLPVAKKSTPTDQMTRQKLREDISRRYFEKSRLVSLPFDRFRTQGCYFRTGLEVDRLGDIPLLYGESYPGYEGYLVVPRTPLSETDRASLSQRFSPCRFLDQGIETGLLIGLMNGAMQTLGLGVLERIDFQGRTISFHTPLIESDAVEVVAFGSLKYRPDGREAGFYAPGQI